MNGRRHQRQEFAAAVVALLLLAAQAITASTAAGRTIGPDAFGYTMTDEVPHDFFDISSFGQRIMQGISNATASDGLPFDFSFYGTSYRDALINSNGTLYLGSTGLPDWVNITLVHPQALRNRPVLVPFWDDTINHPNTSQAVWVATTGFAGSRRHIVQWNTAHNDGPTNNPAQFQIVLYEGSNDIQFNYRDMNFGYAPVDFGGSATVGMRGIDGQLNGHYLRWSHNEPVLHDGLSIRIHADPRGPVETLVPAGSPWRYLDDGSNQGTQWRQPGFNDLQWRGGAAQFGYGDGDEQTIIRGETGPKPITTYFRRTFMVEDAADFETLTLLLLRDDGAAVYLNGFEVARDGLDFNAPFNQYAKGEPVSSDDENAFYVYTLNPQFLRPGLNLLAVEVHQHAPDSTDVSFDLQLIGTRALVPEPATSALLGLGFAAVAWSRLWRRKHTAGVRAANSFFGR